MKTEQNRQHHNNIIAYYDRTRRDYKLFWHNRKNKALHMGYFDENVTTHNDSLHQLNRVMAERVNVQAGDIILDAGCGQGNSASWLAESFPNIEVKGITLVPHQVKIAQREAEKQGLGSRLDFKVGDYCRTGFPDHFFSVVWACESLCHAESKAAFYREAFRILKPGGRLVIADAIRSRRCLPEQKELELRQCFNGFCVPDLDTREEHFRNLSESGFIDIRLLNVTCFVSPSFRRLARISKNMLPLGKLLRHTGLLHPVNFQHLSSSIALYDSLKKDLWYYGILQAVRT